MDGFFGEVVGNVLTYVGFFVAAMGIYLLISSTLEAFKAHPVKTYIRGGLQWYQIFDLPENCTSVRHLDKAMHNLTVAIPASRAGAEQRERLSEYYRCAKNAIKQNRTASHSRLVRYFGQKAA